MKEHINLLFFMFFCLLINCQIKSLYSQTENGNEKSISINRYFSTGEKLNPFDEIQNISYLAISGEVVLNSYSSLIRVILEDDKHSEYLIFEAYPLLADEKEFLIDDVSEETSDLPGITPALLKIQVIDATLFLDSIKLCYGNEIPQTKSLMQTDDRIKKKIEQINKSIKARGMKWIAGETSVSGLSYQEKKHLFGDTLPNIQGLEYYKGGVFEYFSGVETREKTHSEKTIPLVDSFDWRSVHHANNPYKPNHTPNIYFDNDEKGSGWLTPVKDQGGAGTCFAFAIVGAMEAQINLYYNQHVDANLSEQMHVDCANRGGIDELSEYHESYSKCYPGGNYEKISTVGIVDEECDPYNQRGYTYGDQNCCNLNYICADWADRRWKCTGFHDFMSIHNYGAWQCEHQTMNLTEDEFKKVIINKGPGHVAINSMNHAMVLFGYKTDNYERTIWLFKNSWGENWGDNGFLYLSLSESDFNNLYYSVPYYPFIPPQNQVYAVNCLDADGDGYYNWGIGEKPSSCPLSPDEKDGNDADPCIVGMDEFGRYKYRTEKPVVYDVSVNYPDPVPPLSADGLSLRWYSSKDKSHLLASGNTYYHRQTLPGAYTYYVTADNFGCESDVQEIHLTIVFNPPECTDIVAVAGEEIPPFVAKGEKIKWYSNDFNPITDMRDNQTYNTVLIQHKIWMAENLNFLTENAGYYNNDSISNSVYGRLYDYETAMNICPAEFHLSTDSEWKELEKFLGMSASDLDNNRNRGYNEGGKLKESGTNHWSYPNLLATDEYGFTALPAGLRWSSGTFDYINQWGCFWTDTHYARILYYDNGMIDRLGFMGGEEGLSVRCVKEEPLLFEGNIFNTGQTQIGSYTYRVTQSINGIESPPKTVKLTILPPPPKVNDIEICQGDQPSVVIADGENIKWYVFPENAFTDTRDGQVYNVLDFGGHIWMAENLNYYTLSGSWYYNNDSINHASVYGRLYDLETAKAACPDNWRLPEAEEWENLINELGGYSVAGGKLKDTSINYWEPPNTGATDEIGFRALPAGYYHFVSGQTYNIELITGYRSASDFYVVNFQSEEIARYSENEKNGYSVRCLWEGNISGDSILIPFTQPGIYKIAVTQTVNSFESNPDTLEITILPQPDTPYAKDELVCSGDPVPNLTVFCENIKWYSDPYLKKLLHSGNYYITGKKLPGTYNYFVTQTINGCESKADTATLTIIKTPEPPVGVDVSVCENEYIPDLTAHCDSLRWYSDSDLNELLFAGNNFKTGKTKPGEYLYYVTQTYKGCESDADIVELQILSAPYIELGEDLSITLKKNLVLALNNPQLNYQWSDGKNNYFLGIESMVLFPDEYLISFKIINENLCSDADTLTIRIIEPSSIENLTDFNYKFKLFPVPSSSEINIETKSDFWGEVEVSIINNYGIQVTNRKFNFLNKKMNSLTIDISGLPDGLYTILLRNDDQQFSGKILIMR